MLCVLGKLYGRKMIKRITDITEKAIGHEQCGLKEWWCV